MKKHRLLSMLLTLAMVVSSLPMTMATSVSAADELEKVNLADDVYVVEDGTLHDEDEDGYLSIGGRSNREDALQFVYNFKPGTKYKVTFDARMPVPSNSNALLRVKSSSTGTKEYEAWRNIGSTSFPSDEGYETAIEKNAVVETSGAYHWVFNPGEIYNANTHLNELWVAGNDGDNVICRDADKATAAITVKVNADEDVIAEAEAAALAAQNAALEENTELSVEEQKVIYDEAYDEYMAKAVTAAIGDYKLQYENRLSYTDYRSYGDNISMVTLKENAGWTPYTFYYEFAESEGVDTVLDCIGIFAGTDDIYVQSFDIDNFALYEVDGEKEKLLAECDFEDEASISGTENPVAESFKLGRAQTATTKPVGNAEILQVFKGDTEFYRTEGGEGVDTVITFGSNEVLNPGIYEISADLRQAYAVAVAGYYTGADTTATVKVDGDEAAAIDTHINNAWNTLEPIEFVLLEETKMSDITLEIPTHCFEYNTVNTVYPGLDVKSVELYCIEEYDFTDVIDSDDLLDGATVSHTGFAEVVDGSGDAYMSVEPRTWSGEGSAQQEIFKLTLTENIVVGRTYYVGFNVRQSVPSNSSVTARVYTAKNSETGATYVTPSDNSKIGMVSGSVNGKTPRMEITSDWQYFEGVFTPTEGANTAISFQFNRGFGDETQPIDVDNIKVWYVDETTGEKVVYSNDFSSALQADGGTVASNGNLKQKVLYAVEEDYTAVNAAGSNVEIEYTDLDPEITNGIYKLTSSLRVPYYHYE